MSKIATSLIIPTYNKETRLVLTLKSIEKLIIQDDTEILFVNDGSTDNTSNILEDFRKKNKDKFKINILYTSNGGRSHARNIGLKEARGTLLIFTDDDVILHPNFVHYHKLAHFNSNKLVVHGKIYSLPYLKFFKNPITGELYEGGFAKGILQSKTIKSEMFDDNQIETYLNENSKISKFEGDIQALFNSTSIADSYVRWIGFTGGNISIMRSELESINGFDNQMGKIWGCEDIETGYRLYLSGAQFIYNGSAVNYHLNHYRQNSNNIHNEAIDYFIKKHGNEKIEKLKDYYNNKIQSLLEWKDM